jgi:5-formyltetrahydrofolate cyclo-ligase
MTSPAQQKKKLRARILKKRDGMKPIERAARSVVICESLIARRAYQKAKTVAIFVTYRSEVNTLPVIQDLLHKGKCVGVPRITGKGKMEFYRLTEPDSDLVPGTYGIREPKKGSRRVKAEDIDLLVAPGSVLDDRGYRIGYGGGFFDRYIPRLKKECPVISLGFEMQMVKMVPNESFDKKVDMIITEKRVIRTK